jgi:cytochrome c
MNIRLFKMTALALVSTLMAAGCSCVTARTSPAAISPSYKTVAEVAETGLSVYWSSCTACHGIAGEGCEGPAIIGSSSFVGSYGTAQDLLYFITASMPLLTPRTLSHSEYQAVTVHILLQTGLISEDKAINDSNLANITLAR